MNYVIRPALLSETAAISELIAASARGLSSEHYSVEQIEAAVLGIFGVDSELIHDGTYFVAEENAQLIGCGGWSQRRTLFGGDQAASRECGKLDPQVDAARIRAFFVHPNWARRGVATALLDRCEKGAAAGGFRALELMSTLPGVAFYRAKGYETSAPILYETSGLSLKFVPMRKRLH